MNFKYNNVYLNEVSTVTGPYEKDGPLGSYFDMSYRDLYFKMNTSEEAETKLIQDSIDILLNKIKKTKLDIDLHISGDLLNQLTSSNYAASNTNIPFVGVYAACATSTLSLIIGSNMIEANQINNCICTTSSHNNAAEKQFRYPVEYGGPKPKTTTFTSTGGVCAYLSKEKSKIRIDCATIGSVIDMGVKDAYYMGAVMAPAAAKTLYEHLMLNNKKVTDYDLIVTGDLGEYGKKIFKEYLNNEYGITINNYNDCGTMLYDINNQEVYSGGSGPACLPLVAYTYILEKLKEKELKHVLLIATGALMSQTKVNEKATIPSIAHAISLEAL